MFCDSLCHTLSRAGKAKTFCLPKIKKVKSYGVEVAHHSNRSFEYTTTIEKKNFTRALN